MPVEIIELTDLSRRDAQRAGAKAAHLGDLLRAGFAVPGGFVIVPRRGSGDRTLDDEGAETILAAWRRMGAPTVAVRSSAVAEDAADASYAGQYDSFLGVSSPEELLDAVRKVLDSVGGERVDVYQQQRGQAGSAGMAVLVQRQVAADAAGIAFSVNPVTGDRSETVIDAVLGLGDRAASGEVTPQRWTVRADGSAESRGPEAITEEQAWAVAELARHVEDHFGEPQDIEWAIADGELFLLQSRPITALPEPVTPVPVPVEVPEGYWQRDDSHAPKPNTPLYRSLALPHANRAGKVWFAEYGFLMDGLEWREIGGWQYISMRPLGGKERKPPPPWLWPVLVRVVPPLRKRIRSCVEAVRADRANRNLERWYREWKPDLRSRAETLLNAPISELTDAELDRHLTAASKLVGEALEVHFVLHGAVSLHLGELVFACRDLLGWSDLETLETLRGLSGTSTEPAAELAELARQADKNPEVLRLLQDGVVDLDRYVEVDADFAAAFDAYRSSYGHRALRYEVVDPTLNETPELLIQLLRDQISTGFDPGYNAEATRAVAEEKLMQARSMLAGRAGDLTRFERVLARAERAYPVREDNEFFTISLPLGVARLAVLELGRRLADRGQIGTRDDVFFLEFEEAQAALAAGDDQRFLVTRRRGERAWIEAHPGPGSYGEDPGPPPSFSALPDEARFAMEALLWFVDRAFETERSARHQSGSGGVIDGVAGSPGRYRGPVRVVSDETQFAKVQPGDVLVCPVTSPVWSVLFPSIGALVTDTGGILSHPAIIAREYRVPAVVATGNATAVLGDGQIVTVDGSSGVVELVGTGL